MPVYSAYPYIYLRVLFLYALYFSPNLCSKEDGNILLQPPDTESADNKSMGEITIDAGHTRKHGLGLKHIIEQHYVKDKTNEQDIISLLYLVKDSAQCYFPRAALR